MRDHYKKILADTERMAERCLPKQNLQENSPFFGAFLQPDGMYQAKSTIYRFATLLAVYINKESHFYHDPSLIKPMLLALDYVDRVQHENGLFDYVTCNFFSAPDTAFCIVKIIPHLRYMRAMQEKTETEEMLLARMEKIIHLGGRGLVEGGFHTPNHRWAIASVLCKSSAFCLFS